MPRTPTSRTSTATRSATSAKIPSSSSVPLTLPDAESFGIAHPDRDALRRSVGVAKSHGLPEPDCLPNCGTDPERRAERVTHDLGGPEPVAERQRLRRRDGATGSSPVTIDNSHGVAADGTAVTDLGPAAWQVAGQTRTAPNRIQRRVADAKAVGPSLRAQRRSPSGPVRRRRGVGASVAAS